MFNALVTVIGVVVTGLVGWGSKLQSDVKVQDQKITDIKELVNVKLESIDQRLGRIERALNGRIGASYGDSRYNH